MFTGLIEHVGAVVHFQAAGAGAVLRVAAGPVAADARIGDSVAVDGACLTVAGIAGPELAFDVSAETLRVSTLARFRAGHEVNLERALKVGDRLGGHFILGHVDATGAVASLRRAPGESVLRIAAAPEVVRQLVPKGPVAVDGISLTVASFDESGFSVAVIPQTLERTGLRSKKEGAPVNLELDVIGKYVACLLGKRAGATDGGVSERFLAEHGFM
jgi:riboflavin synthase